MLLKRRIQAFPPVIRVKKLRGTVWKSTRSHTGVTTVLLVGKRENNQEMKAKPRGGLGDNNQKKDYLLITFNLGCNRHDGRL